MFKFYGAKYKIAHQYPSPVHDIIIEPFAGSAAYAVRYRSTSTVLLIERDRRVVALWHRLLGMSADELRAMPDPIPGDSSSDLLVAFASGRTTRDTPAQFTVTDRMAQRFRPMVSRIASVVDECRHFEVVEGDYSDAPHVEATWFIDPPYQYQGGRWDRSRGGRYLHSNADINYPELARWAKSRSGQVLVCEREGADWLPWNGGIEARDGGHSVYGEVWWDASQGLVAAK